MTAPPAGARIWLCAGVTDMRRGFTGLSAMVADKLGQNPFDGHLFVFRGRRGEDGAVLLTRAQLSMLLEGIDWRRPERTAAAFGEAPRTAA